MCLPVGGSNGLKDEHRIDVRTSSGPRRQTLPRNAQAPYYSRVCYVVAGAISPCLANVFLHYVLDEWFAAEVQPRLRGPSTLVRFADDFVVILAHKNDAERVLRVLGKRLGKYGLELHPDKTQMIDFRFKP